MSLAVPSALMLGLVALPIIVLYVLKVRLRRIPVSTNMFWKQMFDEKPPRALWRKLRHLVSLLAQLLILALLIFAVADPFLKWQTSSARRIVLIMDTSASMQAIDVKPNRFEAARNAALRLLDGVRESDAVAIVSASNRPEVVLGMGSHVPTLKDAIANMHASDGGADIDQAVSLAKQLIGDHPRGQIVVMTDGCAQRANSGEKVEQLDATAGASTDNKTVKPSETNDTPLGEPRTDASTPATSDAKDASQVAADSSAHLHSVDSPKDNSTKGSSTENKLIDVQYVYFGSPSAANIGITQLQARRSLIDALGYQVLVSVLNSSDKAINCRLELELESVPVDVLPLELQPGQTWTRTLEKTSLEGGTLAASLSKIELMGAEAGSANPTNGSSSSGNARQRESSATKKVTGSQQNLSSDFNQLVADDRAWAIVPPRVIQRVHIVSPGNLFLQKVFEANQLVKLTTSKELPAVWPEDTMVVCHKLVPEKLPDGKLLIIDPDSNCDLMQVGAAIENPIVTKQDDKSNLMTHLRLDNVLIPDAKQLTFVDTAGIVKLAQTVGGETVFASQSGAKSKRLILSVNLEKSDLAFRTAFPILVSNALSWFSGGNGQLEPAIEAGGNAFLATGDNASAEGKTAQIADAKQNSNSGSKPSDQRLWLISPEQQAQVLASTMTGPLQSVGIWTVVNGQLPSKSQAPVEDLLQSGQVVQKIAVNLSSPQESDLRPDAEALSKSAELQASWFTRPVWFYLAALVCLLSVIEWCLYQRRIIT